MDICDNIACERYGVICILEEKNIEIMKQAEATISFSVDVDCPHCYNCFDIKDQLAELEIDPWKENKTGRKHEIDCPKCGESFEVTITY